MRHTSQSIHVMIKSHDNGRPAQAELALEYISHMCSVLYRGK